jgi:hypothetical protein
VRQFRDWERANLQLCHQNLEREQEFARGTVWRPSMVELLHDSDGKFVKFFRLYHWPRNDLQLHRVKVGDKVSFLLILDDLLKLESEPGCI